MDQNELHTRLQKVEDGLSSLQAAFAKRHSRDRHAHRIARIAKVLVANWVLLSFISAILVACYVKWVYGHEFLRQYVSERAQRQIANAYTEQGRFMLARGRWDDAHEAYERAQQIDPYNVTAFLGIIKSEVYRSGPGNTKIDRETAAVKLGALLDISKDLSSKPDDQMYFLEGLHSQSQGDNAAAISFYQQAISLNPDFAASYFQLGGIYSFDPANFSTEKAIEYTKKAIDLDPSSWEAASNLGYEYFVLRDFDHAKEYLELSRQISATWENTFELAEWSRYAASPQDAKSLHDEALLGILQSKSESDPYLADYSVWNFMPLAEGDRKTISCHVDTFRLRQKKAFVEYGLSLDLAMMGDLQGAEQKRLDALRIDSEREYAQYFAEMSQSILNLSKVSERTGRWLQENTIVLAKAWETGKARRSKAQCGFFDINSYAILPR